MEKTNPTVLAKVSQETRQVRDSLDCAVNTSSMSRRVRVLLIAASVDIIGGQSIQAAQLLRRLVSEPAIEIRFLPVNPRLPRLLRIRYLRTLAASLLYLIRLVSNIGRTDVLHIFTPGYLAFYLAPVPALVLARLMGKPAILNYHDGRAEDHLTHWPLARRLMHLAAEIVVPSDYLVDVFARFGLRTKRIHNVVETSGLPYRERLHPQPVFLHNRGLAPEYNVACTLRAFAIVQGKYPEARLTLAHDGPLRSELERLADELGLRQTQFIGPVPPARMSPLYDSVDIYLMSPNADNMPLSALECFSSGLPVVSSSAGGVPHLIEDQVTGLLFPPNDHQAMAACILRLLEEPGLASRLAANARSRCARYAWSEIGPQWIALYAQLSAASISSV